MIGVAVPARADGDDDRFLAMLRAADITFADPDRAITAGKAVCAEVSRGQQMAEVVKSVQQLNPRLQGAAAAQFTAIAATIYCPTALGPKKPAAGGG